MMYFFFFSLYFRYIISCIWVLWPFWHTLYLYSLYIFFFFSLYFRTLYLVYWYYDNFDIHCTYILYILMYVFHLPLHVLLLFSLYAHVSYIMYAIYYFCFTQRYLDKFCLKCFRNTSCQSLTCHRLSSCKNFQEFVLGWILLYSTSEYELSDLWLFSYLICLLWFCHGLPNGEIVRIYVIYLLGTYVTILCNWLIHWQNALYLYLGRSRMCLILQEIVFKIKC